MIIIGFGRLLKGLPEEYFHLVVFLVPDHFYLHIGICKLIIFTSITTKILMYLDFKIVQQLKITNPTISDITAYKQNKIIAWPFFRTPHGFGNHLKEQLFKLLLHLYRVNLFFH